MHACKEKLHVHPGTEFHLIAKAILVASSFSVQGYNIPTQKILFTD